MVEAGARRGAIPLLIVAGALLAGCLHPVKKPGGAAPAEAAAAVSGPQAAGQPTGTAPSNVASLPPVDDDPAHLMGKDAAALRAILGAPRFLRRDNPAQLWRYATAGCVLELYLYQSDTAGTYVVRHLAARPVPADGAPVSERSCLGALLRAHQRAAPG